MFHVLQIMVARLFLLFLSLDKLKKYPRSSIYTLSLLLILISSCSTSVDSDRIKAFPISFDSDHDLYGINFMMDSSIVVVGGTIWEAGIAAISNDLGLNWEIDNISNKALFAIDANRELMVASGIEGDQFFYRNQTWSEQISLSKDHVKDLVLINDSTSMSLGGRNYQDGFIQKVNLNAPTSTLYSAEAELTAIAKLDGNTFIAAGYGIVLKTSNCGEDWTVQDVNGDFYLDLHFIDDQVGFLVGYDGSVLKTEDAGTTWKSLMDKNLLAVKGLRTIYSYDGQEIWIAGDEGLVIASPDGGHSWIEKTIVTTPDLNDLAGLHKMTYVVGSGGSIFSLKLE